MPSNTRWRDLSRTTKSGLVLKQYRLSVANGELVLDGGVQGQGDKEVPRWSAKCLACRMPGTTLHVRTDDPERAQAEAVAALGKFLTEQRAVVQAMLDALSAKGSDDGTKPAAAGPRDDKVPHASDVPPSARKGPSPVKGRKRPARQSPANCPTAQAPRVGS